MSIILPSGRGESRKSRLQAFANTILEYREKASQLMSSRGWCYFLEGFNVLTKGDFNKVQNAINECRKKGYLPIEFVAEDVKRGWRGVETPQDVTPEEYLREWLVGANTAEEYYTPDWWEGEEYYIQAMVEKIDLVNMFLPVFKEYHIPIVNAGGWYDISERAVAARRFKEAEEKGLTPVLVYFGDFDPWGLAISHFLEKNFREIESGTEWPPTELIVDRFGLNFDFIQEAGLTWINNLESGSKKDMSLMDNRIVRNYVERYGVRKCEANAVLRATARPLAIQLCRNTIEKYLGMDALARFEGKREEIRQRLAEFKERTGLGNAITEALRVLDEGQSS